MRVVHIIKVVLVAGAERHLLLLLPALRTLDVHSTLLVLAEPGKPMDDYADMAAAADIPFQRETIHGHADFSLPGRLRAALRTLEPDVVHTHLLHADLYGVPLAKSLGLKAVTSRHNDNAFRRKVPMRALHYGLWRLTDAGIAISDALARFCIDVEGAPRDRIHTVYYGIDAAPQNTRAELRAELGLPPDAVLVGMVCRLIEQKGVAYGIRAFRRIAARYPNAHLVIAGDGPLRAELEAEATDFRAHFLGWREDASAVFGALDVMLMPSLWEGFGLVMLEAMAQAVPIIGSAVSAIPEVIVDGETGLLATPRDDAALAEALDALLADPPRRATMGDAARARLRTHFSVGAMARATDDIYRAVLGWRE